MNAHGCMGGLFFFLKYGIGWVNSFLQQKAGKPQFQNLSGIIKSEKSQKGWE
jgi:hypothetical protein